MTAGLEFFLIWIISNLPYGCRNTTAGTLGSCRLFHAGGLASPGFWGPAQDRSLHKTLLLGSWPWRHKVVCKVLILYWGPRVASHPLARICPEHHGTEKTSISSLKTRTLSPRTLPASTASCFYDLLSMCFVLAPKAIQREGAPPQAADICPQLEEDQCPQQGKPHI